MSPKPATYTLSPLTLDPGDVFHSNGTGWRRAVRVRRLPGGLCEVMHGQPDNPGGLKYSTFTPSERVAVEVGEGV